PSAWIRLASSFSSRRLMMALDALEAAAERHHQAPRGDVDVGIDRLGIAGPVGVTIAHGRQRAPSRRPAARQQNPRFGKRLEHEIYVASEPSATPTRSYALLSNFSPRKRVSLALDSWV